MADKLLTELNPMTGESVPVGYDDLDGGTTYAQKVSLTPGTGTDAPIVYGALTPVAMGNSTIVVVVAANALRRGLLITNISDTIGYLSVGGGTGLTTSNYQIRLAPGETLEFTPPITQQGVSAICGAATKNITYQEAV